MPVLIGTNGNDTIFRQNIDTSSNPIHTGDDTIQSLGGNDRIYDGFGDDTVDGGSGNDIFFAGAGADSYEGGNGNDLVDYSKNAQLQGLTDGEPWTGGIVIDANDGSNSTGIARGDTLTSIERLVGSTGDDTIFAGDDMRISGGAGNDVIHAGQGIESLIGGTGGDLFILAADAGNIDRIRDLSRGEDMLDVSSWGVANFEELTFSASSKDDHIFVHFEGAGFANRGEFENHTLRLDGFSEEDIENFSASDFVFSGEGDGIVKQGFYEFGSNSYELSRGIEGVPTEEDDAEVVDIWIPHNPFYSTFYDGDRIGDFNGDGLEDLLLVETIRTRDEESILQHIVRYTYETEVSVMYGSADIAFENFGVADLENAESVSLASFDSQLYAESMGDVTGDGLADILVTDKDRFIHSRFDQDIIGDRTTLELFIGGPDHANGTADYTFVPPNGGLDYAVNADATGDENGDGINDFYISYTHFSENPNNNTIKLYDDRTTVLVMGGTANLDALDAADGNLDGIIDLEASLGTEFVPTEIVEQPPTTLIGTNTRDVFDENSVDENGNSVDDSGQIVIAGGGRDRVFDGAGDDTVDGGSGRDTFFAGDGADIYMGGSGDDILTYQDSTEGLTIDAQDGTMSTGIAAGDTMESVERVFGTQFADTIRADDDMQIRGLGGDDILYDAEGQERMFGGEGADQFTLGLDGETDRIDDFQIGEDTLDLSAWGVTSFDQLSFSSDGKGARIFVEYEGERLRLDRYTEEDIPLFEAADFVFAEPETLLDAIMLPPLPEAELALLEEEDRELEEVDF